MIRVHFSFDEKKAAKLLQRAAVVVGDVCVVREWVRLLSRAWRDTPDTHAPQSIRHDWLSDSAVTCEVFDSALVSSEAVSAPERDDGFKPHIGSVITGRGFGFVSPESQCSDDSPAQQGIVESSARLLTIGSCVTANELRIKTARNRLANEIANKRRRFLCKLNLIDRRVSLFP